MLSKKGSGIIAAGCLRLQVVSSYIIASLTKNVKLLNHYMAVKGNMFGIFPPTVGKVFFRLVPLKTLIKLIKNKGGIKNGRTSRSLC